MPRPGPPGLREASETGGVCAEVARSRRRNCLNRGRLPTDKKPMPSDDVVVIRPSEGRAINVGDYDWDKRQLLVQAAMKGGSSAAPRRGTKTGKVHLRIVSDRLHDWLLEHVPVLVRRNVEVPLFHNPAGHGDKRWIDSSMRRASRSTCGK